MSRVTVTTGTMQAATKVRRHRGPSAESLREIPPADPSAITFGRGAEGLARAREYSAIMRTARRCKGKRTTALTERTVTLPDAFWAEVERVAKKRFKSADGIIRTAIVQWVLDARVRDGERARKRARKVA